VAAEVDIEAWGKLRVAQKQDQTEKLSAIG